MAKAKAQTRQSEDKRPGYYESDVEGYPGHIQFPYPLILPQFKAWWKVAIEPLKTLSKLDFEHFDAEWQGAKVLLTEFGEWAVEGVPVGEAKEDRVPLEVMSWVVDCADDYIGPQLSEKKARLLSTVS